MFKKSYLATISDDNGILIGSVVVRSWFWHNPLWFHTELGKILTKGKIVDFKRLK